MRGIGRRGTAPGRLRSRGQTHGALLGLAVGIVLTGLVLPFAVGERVQGQTAVGGVGAGTPDPAGGGEVSLGSGGSSGGQAPAVDVAAPSGPLAAPDVTTTTVAVSAAGSGEARRASDVGVAADSVKLGFFLLEVGSAAKIGFAVGVDVAQQQAAYQAYVDEINARGGINGRKVEPYYRSVDVLDSNSGAAACRYMTQDAKVFAATGNLLLPADAACVTRQGRTYFFSANLYADETYQAAGGLLASFGMRGSRMMRNWVAELDRIEYLDGEKIAILSGEATDPSGATANALKAALQAAGHTVVRMSRFSADRGTGSSQIPVEVSQTRGAGATTVFLLSDGLYTAQFVQQADGQGYRPKYTTSPWTSNDTDASMQNLPPSADGLLGVTSAYPFKYWAETAAEKRCIDVYQTRSGRQLPPPTTNEFTTTMVACDVISILERIVASGGVNPTRASLISGAAGLGELGNLAMTPSGSLALGKPDFEDQFRFQTWRASCKCYEPIGEFRAVGR